MRSRWFERWPLVVADRGVVRTKPGDPFDFDPTDFLPGCRFGLPENIPSNGKTLTLFLSEVFCNEFVRRTSEVVDAIRPVLTNVDFPVRVSDSVDDIHFCPVPNKLPDDWFEIIEDDANRSKRNRFNGGKP